MRWSCKEWYVMHWLTWITLWSSEGRAFLQLTPCPYPGDPQLLCLQTLGLMLCTTRKICSGLCGPLVSMRWGTPIPSSEGWSDQVFIWMGMRRTRDVCSKCAGVLIRLLLYDEGWWNEQIPIILVMWKGIFLYSLASSGGLVQSTSCHHITIFMVLVFHVFLTYLLVLLLYMQ